MLSYYTDLVTQATAVANFAGGKAAKKARVMAESILARTRTVYKKLGGKNLILEIFLYLLSSFRHSGL